MDVLQLLAYLAGMAVVGAAVYAAASLLYVILMVGWPLIAGCWLAILLWQGGSDNLAVLVAIAGMLGQYWFLAIPDPPPPWIRSVDCSPRPPRERRRFARRDAGKLGRPQTGPIPS
jgi:hypothetical protein